MLGDAETLLQLLFKPASTALPVLVCISQLDHTWCFLTVSSGTSILLPRFLLPPPHPLPFPFLAISLLLSVSSAFPKIRLFPWFPSLSLSLPSAPSFPPPSPFPSVAVLHSSAQGHPLLCISTSLGVCFIYWGFFPRWYHGHLSGAAAESLLQAKAIPWTFLVRESLSKPGDFVLSVLTDQLKPGSDAPPAGASSASGARLKVTHIKIMCEVSSWERERKGSRRGVLLIMSSEAWSLSA